MRKAFAENLERKMRERSAVARDAALDAVAAFYEAKIKQNLNVQAPVRVSVSRDGVAYVRASTPAIPGAPPRRVSGALQRSVTVRRVGHQLMFKADAAAAGPPGVERRGKGFLYGMKHERGGRSFIDRTVSQESAKAKEIALVVIRNYFDGVLYGRAGKMRR